MTSWDCHKIFFSGKIKILWARIFQVFLWSHSLRKTDTSVLGGTRAGTNNVHWDDCVFLGVEVPMTTSCCHLWFGRFFCHQNTKLENERLEPKNEGGWKIIFLINWVTFLGSSRSCSEVYSTWWLVIPSWSPAKVPLIGDPVQCLLQRCDALLCEACAPRCTISRCHGSSAGAKKRRLTCECLKTTTTE